jgi:hypothetical protein
MGTVTPLKAWRVSKAAAKRQMPPGAVKKVEPFMSNFPVYQSKSMGPVVRDGNLEVSGNKAGACSRWCMADETERRETKQVGASHENGLEQVGARAGCWSRN